MGHLATIRTRWAAVGAALAITFGAVGLGGLDIASADVSSGDRPVYLPINPCRLVDTRPGDFTVGPKTSPLGPEEVLTITAHGSNGECTGPSSIPTDAVGLALNVTAAGPTSNTFLTFWGEGANPGTSNLNPRAGGDPTPNAVNTPLSGTGTFNVFNNRGSVNVIVDVVGYYADHNHDDLYAPLNHAHDNYVPRSQLGIRGFAFSGIAASSGSAFVKASPLPRGVSATMTNSSPGAYVFNFTGLALDEFEPQVLLTPRLALDRVCNFGTWFTIPGSNGQITTATVAVQCSDLTGTPAPTSFSFQITA